VLSHQLSDFATGRGHTAEQEERARVCASRENSHLTADFVGPQLSTFLQFPREPRVKLVAVRLHNRTPR